MSEETASEQWKAIPGYEKYQASTFGQIKGPSGKILSASEHRCYLRVSLSGDKINVHRLIAKTFISNPDNKPEVNHKDGNRYNNKADNLEWTTKEENLAHAVRHNLLTGTPGKVVIRDDGQLYPTSAYVSSQYGCEESACRHAIDAKRPFKGHMYYRLREV